jgi:hypothetical protein
MPSQDNLVSFKGEANGPCFVQPILYLNCPYEDRCLGTRPKLICVALGQHLIEMWRTLPDSLITKSCSLCSNFFFDEQALSLEFDLWNSPRTEYEGHLPLLFFNINCVVVVPYTESLGNKQLQGKVCSEAPFTCMHCSLAKKSFKEVIYLWYLQVAVCTKHQSWYFLSKVPLFSCCFPVSQTCSQSLISSLAMCSRPC